jgi:hypothetical protein
MQDGFRMRAASRESCFYRLLYQIRQNQHYSHEHLLHGHHCALLNQMSVSAFWDRIPGATHRRRLRLLYHRASYMRMPLFLHVKRLANHRAPRYASTRFLSLRKYRGVPSVQARSCRQNHECPFQ